MAKKDGIAKGLVFIEKQLRDLWAGESGHEMPRVGDMVTFRIKDEVHTGRVEWFSASFAEGDEGVFRSLDLSVVVGEGRYFHVTVGDIVQE